MYRAWISLFKQETFKNLNLDQEEESLILSFQITTLIGIGISAAIYMIYIVCSPAIPKLEIDRWLWASLTETAIQSIACVFFLFLVKKKNSINKIYAIRASQVLVFFDVLVFSSFSILFFKYLDSFQMSFSTLVIIVVSVGSTLATFGIKKICYPYILPIYIITTVNYGHSFFSERGMLYDFTYWIVTSLTLLVAILIFVEYVSKLLKKSYDIRFREAELNKKLKEALQESERANKSKVQFLASASHDLRQPVHALSLFSAALRMQPLDGLAKETAKNIDAATQTLSNQLDALFDISKLNTDTVSIDLKVHDVRALFDRLYDEFLHQARAKNLGFEMNLPDKIIVNTDTLLFERVLKNIISNAIKYTHEGQVKLIVEEQDKNYYIQIQDTGLGIDNEAQHFIFDEFYQVDNNERDRNKGLGLGLAIVKRLCEKLQIQIQVDSTKDQGSTFTLITSKKDESACEKILDRNTQVIQKDAQPLQILVVDDDPIALKGTQVMMQALGHAVTAVDNQASALKIVAKQLLNVMLVDYRLKGEENGLHVIKQVKNINPNILMIIISGDVDSEQLRLARQKGIKVLNKPVSVQDIQTLINQSITS